MSSVSAEAGCSEVGGMFVEYYDDSDGNTYSIFVINDEEMSRKLNKMNGVAANEGIMFPIFETGSLGGINVNVPAKLEFSTSGEQLLPGERIKKITYLEPHVVARRFLSRFQGCNVEFYRITCRVLSDYSVNNYIVVRHAPPLVRKSENETKVDQVTGLPLDLSGDLDVILHDFSGPKLTMEIYNIDAKTIGKEMIKEGDIITMTIFKDWFSHQVRRCEHFPILKPSATSCSAPERDALYIKYIEYLVSEESLEFHDIGLAKAFFSK